METSEDERNRAFREFEPEREDFTLEIECPPIVKFTFSPPSAEMGAPELKDVLKEFLSHIFTRLNWGL